MSGNRNTFFRELHLLERRILSDNDDFDRETKSALRKLIDFIAGGAWTTSEKTQFLARNYAVKLVDLPDLYEYQTGEKLSLSAFKSRAHRVSKELYSYFGDKMSDMFLTQNKEGITAILERMRVIMVGDVTFEKLFPISVAGEITALGAERRDYKASDCEEELKFLACVTNKNIREHIRRLDPCKLRWIMGVFGRDLFREGMVDGDKIEVLGYFVSQLEGMKRLELMEDDTAWGISVEGASVGGASVEGETEEPAINTIFHLPSEVYEVLLSAVGEMEPRPPKKGTNDGKQISDLLWLLTEHRLDVLKERLESVDPAILGYVLKGLSSNDGKMCGVSDLMADGGTDDFVYMVRSAALSIGKAKDEGKTIGRKEVAFILMNTAKQIYESTGG